MHETYKRAFKDYNISKENINILKDTIDDYQALVDKWDKAVMEGIKQQNARAAVKDDNGSGKVQRELRNIPDKETIDANIEEVAKMNPVADLTGEEFKKGKVDLVTQVSNYFKEIGGKVVTEYGTINLTRRGVQDSLGHGIGQKKAIAFKAIPFVLKNGKIIDYQLNRKNRGYDTVVFAAPITIANEEYYMATVVNVEKSKNSYYLHEVAIQKKDIPAFKNGTVKNGTPVAEKSSIYILLQKLQKINKNTAQKSSKGFVQNQDRDLVAVHNLTAEELEKTLNLGGFPMPSIAVTKDDFLHKEYGDISVIFSRDTIDPKRTAANKVYGGDAWTPSYPQVEYKINSKKASEAFFTESVTTRPHRSSSSARELPSRTLGSR